MIICIIIVIISSYKFEKIFELITIQIVYNAQMYFRKSIIKEMFYVWKEVNTLHFNI